MLAPRVYVKPQKLIQILTSRISGARFRNVCFTKVSYIIPKHINIGKNTELGFKSDYSLIWNAMK